MTNEELVKLYQEGDNSALDELINKNMGIIHKIAKKFYVGGINSIEYEDLTQEGSIGLMLAAQKYNFYEDKRASFSTYAFYWIYQKMNRYIHNSDTNEEVSLNKPITIKDDIAELQDTLADDKDGYEEADRMLDNTALRVDIDKSLLDISLYHRNVVKLLYGLDCESCTRDEVADILCKPRENVRNAELQALRKLRMSKYLVKYKEKLNYDNMMRKEELLERQFNNGKYLYV